MLARNHKHVATITVLTAGTLIHQPAATAIVYITARATSSLPDTIEKPLGIPHRHWTTHGPLFVTPMLAALDYNLAAYGPGAALAALGITIGILTHLIADGCSLTGLPAHPFPGDLHLLPAPLRYRVGGSKAVRRRRKRRAAGRKRTSRTGTRQAGRLRRPPTRAARPSGRRTTGRRRT
jgi:hypothetical protein